ncbi:VapA/VapB family virulence-associated protein [Labrys sp. KNU-23]|uniref:VapA/VapB family virulence-associated protein n=1 Tax=Labrys sp. KNU-23 TaxID=2789216 RepID=UPI0011EE7AD1|nr:VapA/VapB family virulence-associated protein [Labrys sp. KNU-23]QEN89292.1 VapA/VapB family virulence-associated protein [Labrys sp. KNU-23]
MDDAKLNFDPNLAAREFANSMAGLLAQDQINAATADMLGAAAANQYPAKCSIISAIFYLRFTIEVTADRGYGRVLKTFTGNAGGISSPGGGALFGTVFTNDINRLYAETVSFQFNSSPVMLNVNFFSKGHAFLGNYMSGGVSTVGGTGGGSGHWK